MVVVMDQNCGIEQQNHFAGLRGLGCLAGWMRVSLSERTRFTHTPAPAASSG
jgi:hypothetical protein